MNNTTNIFQNTDCFTQQQLLRYVKSELTKAEARAVELHLTDCEICFDVVEGLSLVDKSHLEKIESELQQRIQQKLKTEEQHKVIPLFKKWYSAAAAVLLVFLVSVYLVKLYVKQDNAGLAETKTEKAFQTNEPAKQINDESALRNDTITSSLAVQQSNEQNRHELKQQIVAANNSNTEKPENDSYKGKESVNFKSNEVLSESDKKLAENKNESDEIRYAPKGNVAADVTAADAKDVETIQQPRPVVEEKASAKSTRNAVQKTEDKFIALTAPATTTTGATSLSKSSDYNAASTFDFDLYDKGVNYFNAKDYTNALSVFNQLLAKQPDNINSNYYAGVSNYNLGNYASAIQHLNIVTNYKHNSFYESSLWFKGNALLKLDNKKEAKKTLEAIVKQKGNYKSQAEELLKDL